MEALDELRANRRLRMGLVAIIAILISYGLLEWRDRLTESQAAYRRLLTQVARLGQLEPAQLWAQRGAEAQAALKHERQRLWGQATGGQAQAKVQDWVFGLLRQIDAKNPGVRVSEPETSLDAAAQVQRLPAALKDLRPIRARVEFNSDPLVLLGLLAALNDADRQVVVDALAIKPVKTELQLSFWFEMADGARPKAPE